MSAVQPEGRFGALDINTTNIKKFVEKPAGDGNWINAGFMVCHPDVIRYIENDESVFEQDPLQNLAREGQLGAFKHTGFWKCMDTLRDKIQLNNMWKSKNAEWKVW